MLSDFIFKSSILGIYLLYVFDLQTILDNKKLIFPGKLVASHHFIGIASSFQNQNIHGQKNTIEFSLYNGFS